MYSGLNYTGIQGCSFIRYIKTDASGITYVHNIAKNYTEQECFDKVYQTSPKIYFTFLTRCSSMIMSRHGSLGFGRGLALGAGSEHSYSGLGIGSDPEREVKVSRGKRPGAYTPPPPSSAWSPGTILAKMFDISV